MLQNFGFGVLQNLLVFAGVSQQLCSRLSLATVYYMLYIITVQILAALAAQLWVLISK